MCGNCYASVWIFVYFGHLTIQCAVICVSLYTQCVSVLSYLFFWNSLRRFLIWFVFISIQQRERFEREEKKTEGEQWKKNQSALWWYNDNSYFTLLFHRDPRLRIPSPNDVIQWYFRLLSLLLLLLLLVLPIRLIQLAKRRDGVFRDQITNISLNIIT